MQAEIRKKESERLDFEHMKTELLRLKRSKEHLEDVLSHRQVEFTEALKDRDTSIAEFKSNHAASLRELTSLREELTSTQSEKDDALDQIKSLQEKVSRITKDLHVKGEEVERLQSKCNNLESFEDGQDTIRSLTAEAEKFAMDQLKQKIIRLNEHRDHLESLIKSRMAEYEKFMNERTNEVAESMK